MGKTLSRFIASVPGAAHNALGMVLHDKSAGTMPVATKTPLDHNVAAIMRRGGDAKSRLNPFFALLHGMVLTKTLVASRHLQSNPNLASNMVTILPPKLDPSLASDIDNLECLSMFRDGVASPTMRTTLSAPWLLGVQPAKAVSGCSAIPLMGLGALYVVAQGEAFVMAADLAKAPAAVNLARWLLKEGGARKLHRLGDSMLDGGLAASDALWLPAGCSPMFVATAMGSCLAMVVVPFRAPTALQNNGVANVVVPENVKAIDQQLKAKNPNFKILSGLRSWVDQRGFT